jgi:hypothetical protein
MTKWFDELSKTLARATVLGGASRPSGGVSTGFVLSQTQRAIAIQSGPCRARLTADELDTQFSTQISTPDRQLLSYDAATVSQKREAHVQATVSVQRGDEQLLELVATSRQHTPSNVRVLLGARFNGIREVSLTNQNGRLEGSIDGRAIVPVSLSGRGPTFSAEDFQFAPVDSTTGRRRRSVSAGRGSAGGRRSSTEVDPVLLAELQDVAYKAQRDMPYCVHSWDQLRPQADIRYPGCDDCDDQCDKKQNTCIAECFVKAASCGPFYGVCLAGCGASCLSDYSDCWTQCHNPPGACCPQRCEQDGFASCCPPNMKCCGASCAPPDAICCGSSFCNPGQHCADPGSGVCCDNDSGPLCGEGCCPRGQKCASPNWGAGFCCSADAGEFCMDEWSAPFCCPSGQVCRDINNGVCCTADSGPLCGDRCCGRHEICRDNICCDPRLLCGDGERAVCCYGECRNGECCSSPSHMCGDVCCPPFNVCCNVDGAPVCCGGNEVCLRSGCCPADRACGERCCPPGFMCEDPAGAVCVPCPQDTIACVSMLPDGRRRSTCCLPNVTCCAGKCCPPGEICCQPGGLPVGCYPSHACVR